MGRFLITIFHLNPKYYIFLKPQAKSSSMKITQTSTITSRTLEGWRTSSKYEEVPDNYISLNTPRIINFWKLQANSSTINMTPTIMITNRNLMRMEDVLQVWLLTTIFHLTPQIEYIFWKPQPLLNSAPSPTLGAIWP